MLDSARMVAFSATSDAARTRKFYEGVLGLRLVSDDEYALVFDANGQPLRIARVREVVVAPYTVLGWQVPDATVAVKELLGRGAVFERYDGLEHDELGIWHVPGGGQVAWFKDPEGHLLSVSSDA